MRIPHESVCEWPLQIISQKNDRNTWLKALRKLVSNNSTLSSSLGKWIARTHQLWKYMVSSDRFDMLRYENGVKKRIICLTNSRFTKIVRICHKLKTGIQIHCVPPGVGYKEADNPSKYIIVTKAK